MNKWDKLYCEISYLALLVNRHTEYAVWIEMVGHVSWTTIKISKSKESYWQVIVEDEILRHTTTSFHKDWNGSSAIDKLVNIRDQLKHILETGDVNYEAFEKHHYETWDYVF